MAKNPFGPFPQQPQRNPYFDPASLPNWMRRNLEAGVVLQERQKQLQATLTQPAVRKLDIDLLHRRQAELRRSLGQTLRAKNVTLSAQAARRLQSTLSAAAQALEAGGSSLIVVSVLRKWDSFLEASLSQ